MIAMDYKPSKIEGILVELSAWALLACAVAFIVWVAKQL